MLDLPRILAACTPWFSRSRGLAVTADHLVLVEQRQLARQVPLGEIGGVHVVAEADGNHLFLLVGLELLDCPLHGSTVGQAHFVRNLMAAGAAHPGFAADSDFLLGLLQQRRAASGDPLVQAGPLVPAVDDGARMALAVAALALLPLPGLLAAPVALVLALRAQARLRREPQLEGRGAARAALALSGIALLGWGLLLARLAAGSPVEVLPAPLLAAQLDRRGYALFALAFVVAVIYHEYGHSLAAYWNGDRTSRRLGRLSVNPLRHVDPLGSVAVPLALYLLQAPIVLGWARPVPIGVAYLRDRRWSLFGVALARPLMNFLLALGAAWLLIAGGCLLGLLGPGLSVRGFSSIGWVEINGLAAGGALAWILQALKYCVLLNLFLGGLNLVPVPPLDGARIASSILPPVWGELYFDRPGCGLLTLLVLLLSGLLLVPLAAASLAGLAVIWVCGLAAGLV